MTDHSLIDHNARIAQSASGTDRSSSALADSDREVTDDTNNTVSAVNQAPSNESRQRFRGRVMAAAVMSLLMPLVVIHRLAFAFDRILFPRLAGVHVQSPLFIVGLPRSGTTLCHRLMAQASDRFTSMPLWELLLAPALCEKYLIAGLAWMDRLIGSPAKKLIRFAERKFGGTQSAIHATSLESPEEDYLGLLPFGGCFLAVLIWPFHPGVWRLANIDHASHSQRQRLLAAYKGLLQRHLAFRGHDLTVLSKNPSFTGWVHSLQETFPDMRLIGLRRDPVESVPSQLSSLRDGFALFGHDVTDPRIVTGFVKLLRDDWHLLDQYLDTVHPDQYQLIPYRELIQADSEALLSLLQSFGYDISDNDVERIEAACAAARQYRSQHHYQLSEFGLNATELQQQFFATNRLSPRSSMASETSPETTIPHDENDDDRLSLISS